MFASRLADQRARVVVMMRQGAVPEDLENEKIVELQLQKKQVQYRLFYNTHPTASVSHYGLLLD